jgi:hypothetical protein
MGRNDAESGRMDRPGRGSEGGCVKRTSNIGIGSEPRMSDATRVAASACMPGRTWA